MYSTDGAISTDPVWCSCTLVPGIGGEVRQLAQGEVDLHDAAAALPVLDVADEVTRKLVASDVLQEGDLGVKAR